MRTALLLISALAAIFFALSFLLTFFARGYLTQLAQDFVIDRTQKYADPAVATADQALKAPGIRLVLNDEQIQSARREIDAYQEEPRGYIAKLVAGDGNPPPAAAPPGANAALAERVLHWKGRVRAYFDATLGRLLRDLRIFFGSNAVAAIIAFAAAWWSQPGRFRGLALVCVLLLASVAFSSYMYVDEFSYFKILFNSYMGWWYPFVLAVTFMGALIEYGRSPRPSQT